MTLFFVEYRFLPYTLLTTVKIGPITDFENRILLITEFWDSGYLHNGRADKNPFIL